jgi:hypothetical protein
MHVLLGWEQSTFLAYVVVQFLGSTSVTPPRLIELQCPSCSGKHWVIDSDVRGSEMVTGVPEEPHKYRCPKCGHDGPDHRVLRKSPPEFFLQPHQMYPMTQKDFDYWVAILKEHFPDDRLLAELGKSWRPGKK